MSETFGALAPTVATAFSAAAERDGVRLAMGWEGTRSTMAEVDDLARRLSAGLRSRGVRRGDRVMIIARNRPEHVLVLLATTRLGGLHTAVHPEWTGAELARVIADAEPRVLVAERQLVDDVRRIAAGTSVRHVVDLDDELAWGELFEQADEIDDVTGPNDDCAVWYTSGTSGIPKGVVWTHEAFLFNALAINHALDIGSQDIGLRVSPMAHNGISSAVVGTMLRGAPVHMLGRFDAPRVIELIRHEQVTWMNLVPAAAHLLLASADELGVTALPSLRRLLVGAAPTPPPLLERLAAFLPGCAIVHGYGATEGYISVCRPTSTSRVDGSVGTALPGVAVRVVDEFGANVPAGTTGRVLFSSPGAMSRYWRNPSATAAVVSPDGWLDIGDYGHKGEDGSIWLVGRNIDVINTGGYNVYASEVETVLHRMPGVSDVAVIGLPDDVLGQRVAAFIEPLAGQQVDLHLIRSECAQSLARYKRPAEIIFVEALPRNTYGKLNKRQLISEVVG